MTDWNQASHKALLEQYKQQLIEEVEGMRVEVGRKGGFEQPFQEMRDSGYNQALSDVKELLK